MAWNTGMITGKVYRNWQTGTGPGFLITLQSLTLGDKRFTILNPNTEQIDLQPQVYSGDEGYFLIPFFWYPEHIGEIDQPLRAKVTASYLAGGEWARESEFGKVGLYVSFGKIYKGMGGSTPPGLMPGEGFTDVINYWTDVYSTLKNIPVPQVLKQTGFMSPEAFGLLGHVNLSVPDYAKPVGP